MVAEALRETRGAGGLRLREELGRDREFHGLTGTFSFKQGYAVRPLYVVRGGEVSRVKSRGCRDSRPVRSPFPEGLSPDRSQ